jgi:hypothetical protein
MELPATPPPAAAARGHENEKESYLSERVKTIGGLIAVGIGVLAVTATAIVAIAVDNDDAATIASAAGGVIATIVGAYFGIKAGSDRAKAAGDDQKAEAAKAQVYALHLPPEKARQVQNEAETAAQAVSE